MIYVGWLQLYDLCLCWLESIHPEDSSLQLSAVELLLCSVTSCWLRWSGGFDGFEMVERVEPLAHDLSLSPLNGDLVLGEGSQQHEQAHCVADAPVLPDSGDASTHLIWEVVLLDVQQVGCSGSGGEEGWAQQDSLWIVKSVNYGFVLLPLVCLHLIIIFIITITIVSLIIHINISTHFIINIKL